MCLVVEAAFARKITPAYGVMVLDFQDCFLKAHDLHVLFWCYPYLFLEHIDEMLLRISYLSKKMLEGKHIWLMHDLEQGIFNAVHIHLDPDRFMRQPQQKFFNEQEHLLNGSCSQQLLTEIQNLPPKDQVRTQHLVCYLTHRQWVEGMSLAFLESHNQHPAAIA